VFDTDTTGTQRLGGRSAAVSLLVHAAAVLSAFLAGGPITQLVVPPRATALIVAPPVQKSVNKLVKPPALPPRLRVPRPVVAFKNPIAPALRLPMIELPQAPAVEPLHLAEPAPELPQTQSQFTLPVKTGEFAAAAPAIPTRTVQPPLETSGFNTQENSHAAPARTRPALSTSGFDSAGATMEHHMPSSLSQTGFSSTAPFPAAPIPAHAITKSAFGDVVTQAPNLPSQQPHPSDNTTPAEILSKPRPVYTAEARTLEIEGEVLVEVVLEASGRVRVVSLVKGLGHGLDENAQAAAREIRFRPALKEGVPTDSSAVVHILFQLAY